ncbi:MAG: ChaN family lipoprotein [Bacteroidia bacterium]
MKKAILLSVFLTFSLIGLSQDKAYVIYNSKGKKVSYKKMIKQLNSADVVMFGELHNNPIAHWLQLEVTQSLSRKNDLILGAEMMEADNQNELNAYLGDSLDQKGLDTAARLWPNYKTDYAPLVDFAKENNIHFVATNIPRRYANMVYRNGFEILDSLSAEEKSWMAPLPMKFDSELPSYQRILEMMGDHGSPSLVMAQATKDATMAHFILENYKIDHLFIHYNGAYHSDYHEGIVWYLNQERTDLNYKTITTVSQASIKKLLEENKGKADFIICVDEDMTTTY